MIVICRYLPIRNAIGKLRFRKSPFAKRPMVKRALFIRNQLGIVSVTESVESDKKVLHWFYVMSFIIRRSLDFNKNISRKKVSEARRYNLR